MYANDSVTTLVYTSGPPAIQTFRVCRGGIDGPELLRVTVYPGASDGALAVHAKFPDGATYGCREGRPDKREGRWPKGQTGSVDDPPE
jgi:hypothetical protein